MTEDVEKSKHAFDVQ